MAVAKSGYNIIYTASDAVGGSPVSCTGAAAGTSAEHYLAVADPQGWNTSGTRHFGTSEAQTIFQETSDTAISAISPTGVPAPPTATALK